MDVLDDLDEQLAEAGVRTMPHSDPKTFIQSLRPHRSQLSGNGEFPPLEPEEWKALQIKIAEGMRTAWTREAGPERADQQVTLFLEALHFDARHGTSRAHAVSAVLPPTREQHWRSEVGRLTATRVDIDIARYMIRNHEDRLADIRKWRPEYK